MALYPLIHARLTEKRITQHSHFCEEIYQDSGSAFDAGEVTNRKFFAYGLNDTMWAMWGGEGSHQTLVRTVLSPRLKLS